MLKAKQSKIDRSLLYSKYFSYDRSMSCSEVFQKRNIEYFSRKVTFLQFYK